MLSSFKVTFPDDERVYQKHYAYLTFVDALNHIGLDRLARLRIRGCKSRVTVKKHARGKVVHNWLKLTRDYCIFTHSSNSEKRRYIETVCDELGVRVTVEM